MLSSNLAPQKIDEDRLRKIAEDFLLPFFSGATLGEITHSSNSREKNVTFKENRILFKVDAEDFRLELKRDQPFSKSSHSNREQEVVEAFVEVVGEIAWSIGHNAEEDLFSAVHRRVVARATADRLHDRAVLKVIDQMIRWASRLYEGRPISSAVGIEPYDGKVPEPEFDAFEDEFDAFVENDTGLSLSNGTETMIVFNKTLQFVGYRSLQEQSFGLYGNSELLEHPPSISYQYIPIRYERVSRWTAEKTGRIAIILNEVGEILVVRDGQLLFVRRNGDWHFLTHETVVSQMSLPKNRQVREAVYQTALDASFARTGACLGVISSKSRSGRMEQVRKLLRSDFDVTLPNFLKRVLDGRKFQNLDRVLRQELAAIDGATLIGHDGELLAVGAILAVGGGLGGGGRSAAAIELSKFGLGVKVSQDGEIRGYRRSRGLGLHGQPSFRVM